jgi:hypothetical protein
LVSLTGKTLPPLAKLVIELAKEGQFTAEAKAEQSRLRAATLALRDLCGSI